MDCIHRAYDLGVNFFDTANVYMRGRAEEVVGKALAGFPREFYVLATKVFFDMGDGPNDGGPSRKHVLEQAHASLRRLGVDYVDLYQCHRYDEDSPLGETRRVMDDSSARARSSYWGGREDRRPDRARRVAAPREGLRAAGVKPAAVLRAVARDRGARPAGVRTSASATSSGHRWPWGS